MTPLDSSSHGMRPLPRVAARLAGSFAGGLVDVGRGGLALETTARLTPNQRLEVHVGQGSASLRAEIVWSSLHRNRPAGRDSQPVYRAGGRFVAPELSEPSTSLDRFETNGRRYPRYAAEGESPVRLDVEHLVAVRALGSLGLRIESKVPLTEGSIWTLDLDLGGPVLHPEVRVSSCEPLAPENRTSRWAVELVMIELEDDEARALREFLGTR